MSNIITISGIRGFIDENSVAQLNTEDVARGWGFTQKETKNGKEYITVRWSRVFGYLDEFGFDHKWSKDGFIPENMVYRLGFKASNEAAQVFQAKLADEVLPALRKTGTYSINPAPKEDAQIARAKAMLLNAKTRAAQTWLKIAATVNIPEYKQIASTYAANTLADREVLALPQVERKTYTATEIGKMFDVSSNKIGKLANEHGLKTKEYGMEVWDKARHSAKQIPAWRYYENAIPVFAKLLGKEVA